MIVVVDTNIIFSALLTANSAIRKRLFDREHTYVCPAFVFLELFEKKERILRYSKVPVTEVYEFMQKTVERMHFMNDSLVTEKHFELAYDLCKDIDVDDTPFVALTLELGGCLWTGDRKLKKHLEKKGFRSFFE